MDTRTILNKKVNNLSYALHKRFGVQSMKT